VIMMAMGLLDSRKRIAPAAVLAFLRCVRSLRVFIKEEYCRLKWSAAARLSRRTVDLSLGADVVVTVEELEGSISRDSEELGVCMA
jgi:hypothetical protein